MEGGDRGKNQVTLTPRALSHPDVARSVQLGPWAGVVHGEAPVLDAPKEQIQGIRPQLWTHPPPDTEQQREATPHRGTAWRPPPLAGPTNGGGAPGEGAVKSTALPALRNSELICLASWNKPQSPAIQPGENGRPSPRRVLTDAISSFRVLDTRPNCEC